MRRGSANSSTMLLSGGRPSPLDGSTPLIEDESDAPYSSTRSTPCPPGQAARSPASRESTQPPPSSNHATPGDPEVHSEPPRYHEARHAAASTEEERHLKESIASLRQKLEASTALVDRLHLRNEVYRLENEMNEKKVQQVRLEQQSAKEEAHTATEAGRKRQMVLSSMLCLLLLALLIYINWSLFHTPEVAYVRQRRRALLGL